MDAKLTARQKAELERAARRLAERDFLLQKLDQFPYYENDAVEVRFWRRYDKTGTSRTVTMVAITDKETCCTTTAGVGVHPRDSYDTTKGRIEALWKALRGDNKYIRVYDAAGWAIRARYFSEFRPQLSDYDVAALLAMTCIRRMTELSQKPKAVASDINLEINQSVGTVEAGANYIGVTIGRIG